MKYRRRVMCIRTYDEDLTGNDDFVTLWVVGNAYGAVKHRNGSWSIETEIGTTGMVGESYMCPFVGYFVEEK